MRSAGPAAFVPVRRAGRGTGVDGMVLGGPGAVHRSAADARVRSARFRHMSHNESTPRPCGRVTLALGDRVIGGAGWPCTWYCWGRPLTPSWSGASISRPRSCMPPRRASGRHGQGAGAQSRDPGGARQGPHRPCRPGRGQGVPGRRGRAGPRGRPDDPGYLSSTAAAGPCNPRLNQQAATHTVTACSTFPVWSWSSSSPQSHARGSGVEHQCPHRSGPGPARCSWRLSGRRVVAHHHVERVVVVPLVHRACPRFRWLFVGR